MVDTKLAWLQERKGCDRKGSLLGEEMRTIGTALERDQTDGMPVSTICTGSCYSGWYSNRWRFDADPPVKLACIENGLITLLAKSLTPQPCNEATFRCRHSFSRGV
jgi:hypothetical protein